MSNLITPFVTVLSSFIQVRFSDVTSIREHGENEESGVAKSGQFRISESHVNSRAICHCQKRLIIFLTLPNSDR